MTDHLTEELKTRHGDISLKNGTMVDYLGMSIDFTHPGEFVENNV